MNKLRALFTSIVLIATLSGVSLFGPAALVSATSIHAASVTSATYQLAAKVKPYPDCPYPGQMGC